MFSKQINRNQFISYLLLIFAIFICSYFWDFIKLPFDYVNAIYGDSYIHNQYNSLNDDLKFLFYISIPLIVFLISKILIKKKIFKIIYFSLNFNFNKTFYNNHLNFYLIFFLFLIFFEFLIIDYSKIQYGIDIFHEGLWLTASSNLNIKGEVFDSSYVGRGLFGNFNPYLLWKIIGFESIGVTRFFKYFILNFLVKFAGLILIKNIVLFSDLNKNKQIFFFIILSFIFLFLTPYQNSLFSDRHLLSFIFLNFILVFFFRGKKKINVFFIGNFSLISMLWYIDIGAYVNLFLVIFLTFLLINKNFKSTIVLMIGIIFPWLIFFLIFPQNEFYSFITNTKLIYKTIDQIHGLIYPTPFFSGNSRATKALLLFIISGVLIINLFFEKGKKHFTFLMIILFIFSVISFKYGISRSDGPHIRIASGFITLTFLFILIHNFIYFYNKHLKFRINFIKPKKFFLLSLFFLSFYYLFLEKEKSYTHKNLKNINSFFPSIIKIIKLEDKVYLNSEYSLFLDYYKGLTINDKCVYSFTNEIALPYLLKKPTCTKYFINYISSPQETQKQIILDLINKRPNYIIYKSGLDLYGDSPERLKQVNEFIVNNYNKDIIFLEWEIYKLNDF